MRRVLVVLCGLIPLVAAGCSGSSPAPNLSTASVSSPPPQTSVTVTPLSASAPSTRAYPAGVPLTGHNVRPGEKPPLYPAAAKAKTQDGANAFAEFFMKTFDWAYATTNPSYARFYTAPSCGLCTGLETGIAKTAAKKRWYLGGRFTVHPAIATKVAPVKAPADFCSKITVSTTAEELVDKTGKVFAGDQAYPSVGLKICVTMTGSTWHATYMAHT